MAPPIRAPIASDGAKSPAEPPVPMVKELATPRRRAHTSSAAAAASPLPSAASPLMASWPAP
jgi:hypothetical protein